MTYTWTISGICILNFEQPSLLVSIPNPMANSLSGSKACAAIDNLSEIYNLGNELIQGIGTKLNELNSKAGTTISSTVINEMLRFFKPNSKARNLDPQTLTNLISNLNTSSIQLQDEISNSILFSRVV